MINFQTTGELLLDQDKLGKVSQQRLGNIVNSSKDAIIGATLEGKITSWNPGAVRMFGYSPEEIIGKPMSVIFPSECLDEELEIKVRMGRGERMEHFDSVRIRKGGERLDVSVTITPEVDVDSGVVGSQSIVRDITERKRLAKKLTASEGRYRRLFESAKDGIFILNAESGEILDINPSLMEMLGYSLEELLGKRIWEISAFQDIAGSELAFCKLRAKEYVLYEDLQIETKSGSLINAEFVSNVYRVDGEEMIQCNVRDTTERMRIEHNMFVSEMRYRRLFETAENGILVLNADTGRIVDVNPFLCELLGYQRDHFVGRKLWELEPFGGIAGTEEKFVELQQADSRHGNIPMRTAEGRNIDVEFVSTVYGVDGHRVIQFNIRDNTERKQAEEKLRKLSCAVDQSPALVVITDKEGRIEYVNPKFTQVTGYSLEEVLGQKQSAFRPDEASREEFQNVWSLVTTGKEWHGEFRNRKKDGELYWEAASISPIRDEEGNITHFLTEKEDITERKKLEDQFRQSQKMESIGQLAGGVAHDFNNILAVIQMQAGLLKCSANLSAEENELTDDIIEAVERAAALTRQLLLFSRVEVMREQDLDLNQTIQSMLKMLNRTIDDDVEVQLKLSERPMFLHADPGMIDQVLLNLALNARDAMPKGGQLLIETYEAEFDEETAAHSASIKAGSFVCLSVSDTGCGISRENLQKVFEPFFTTKEVGKGTGLGLATVFGIVQQHNGWINVYSEEGRGTVFRIYLPRLADGSRERNSEPGKIAGTLAAALPEKKETILLVEDDSALRHMLQLSLNRLGYHVLVAADGIEALTLGTKHIDEIQLVLTDMVMPGGMTGIEVGAHLLKEKPELKVIYASGYSAEVADKGFSLTEGVNFLSKPFQTAHLAETLRSALSA